MAKEFLPDIPQEMPVVVSTREAKVYAFDLSDWLNEGETVMEADVTTVLRTRYGDDVADTPATINGAPQSPNMTVLVDWTKTARAQEYYLWILFTKTGRKEEGYLRFRTHPV